MYLIQPEETSAMWMKPSFPSYSSSLTNAPKFLTFDTEQTTSPPSSGHSYSRPRASGSLVHLDELELLRPDPPALVRLLARLAPIAEVDPLRRLLAPLWLRPGEASVPCGDPPEPSLAGAKLGAGPGLHPLDLQLHVLVAVGAIPSDHMGYFHRIGARAALHRGTAIKGLRGLPRRRVAHTSFSRRDRSESLEGL